MSTRLHSCPECGCLLTRPRSTQDHRRFFGLIAKAAAQWPHAHPFQPSNPEHLRAYLLVESGHHVATPVFVELDCFPEAEKPAALKLVTLAVEASVAAALSQGAYAFVRIVGDTITVFRPKDSQPPTDVSLIRHPLCRRSQLDARPGVHVPSITGPRDSACENPRQLAEN